MGRATTFTLSPALTVVLFQPAGTRPGGRRHLQVPDRDAAFAVRHFDLDPGVGIRPLELFDGAFDRDRFRLINTRRRVVREGRPCDTKRDRKGSRDM